MKKWKEKDEQKKIEESKRKKEFLSILLSFFLYSPYQSPF